jgi:Cytochrome c
VVGADPDRDQLYFVDANGTRELHTRVLQAGDEPGRLVEDAAGRIHVVLRGAGAIATLGRDAESTITRRDVCAVPRGIAYDAARDQLHVACAEGKLVTLAAAPTGTMTRALEVAPDLRDVLVRGDQIFVTRFRAAQLLVLDADGVVQETRTPTSFTTMEGRGVLETLPGSSCGKLTKKLVTVEAKANVAWRTIDVPHAGVAMLHQRSRTEEIQTTVGGYGASQSCGGSIVQTVLTTGVDTQSAATGDVVDVTLGVDVATDPEGVLLAVVAPANQEQLPQVQVLPLVALQDSFRNAVPGSSSGVIAEAGGGPTIPGQERPAISGKAPCVVGSPLTGPQSGQATAVSFVSPHMLAVQEREPTAISFYDVRTYSLTSRIALGGKSRANTGHRLFHMRTGAGLACASCHPEAGDDGHVWTFAGIGPRRTQTLRGGILGTEPLHWNGDMQDFTMLMKEVFEGRMLGFAATTEQTDTLAHWLDNQPALHAQTANAAAAERGKQLFESQEVGCNECHAGAHLTNNSRQDVGTGAALQVPSLKGIRFRTPLMHDGCAASIIDRLNDPGCGGGDKHGKTSQLSPDQLNDLTAYLETL